MTNKTFDSIIQGLRSSRIEIAGLGLLPAEQRQSINSNILEAEIFLKGVIRTIEDALAQEESDKTEVRLWDSQWTNVVNHDNCYASWTKEDAIHYAVKMTEQLIAENVDMNNLPPK